MLSRRIVFPVSMLSLACLLLPSAVLACCFGGTIKSTPVNPEFSAFFYSAYHGWGGWLHFALTVMLCICAVMFSLKRRGILDDLANRPGAEYSDREWKTLWSAFLLRHGACFSAVAFYTLALRPMDICRDIVGPDFGDAISATLFFGAIHVCSLVASARRYGKIPCMGWLPIGYASWGSVMIALWLLCEGLREEMQYVPSHALF